MKLLERKKIGDGKVFVRVLNDDGNEQGWVTSEGSDSDIQLRPHRHGAHAGRRFESHIEEYNVKRRGMKEGSLRSKICQELHERSGKTEAAWRERGGNYGRMTDQRGTVIAGPIFRSDRERSSYIQLHNSLHPRMQFHEA
jgi:hypothetical protein